MLDAGSFAHHQLRKSLCYLLREGGNLRGASFLHATSNREAESIRRLGIGVETCVIPNGIAPPERIPTSNVRTRLRLPARARVVAFLGRLHPTKRLDLLIAAFQDVRKVVPDCVLVLAGRPDGIDPRSLGLGSEIRWLGELDETEKWELLSEVDVVVLCSDSESFGLCVLEALSVGVPVVVTRTCPWEEVESHGCGFWVAQDTASLAAATCRILTDAELAQRMKENALALVKGRFEWSAIGREMAHQYALHGRTGET
jgi:glycosyltransferase involved in cell wall biosynthesis